MSGAQTARDVQCSLADLDVSLIPEWNMSDIQRAFKIIRDERFLLADDMPDFPRRIPWLFVKNGCFLKAALVRRRLADLGFPKIKKLFAFGEMKFQTKLSPSGSMTFNDHVVVAVRHNSDVFVFDPSLNLEGPMALTDWATALSASSNPNDLAFSICSEYTLGHNSPANVESEEGEVGSRNGEMKSVDFFTQDFLRQEFEWVKHLGLEPIDTLASDPLLLSGFQKNEGLCGR